MIYGMYRLPEGPATPKALLMYEANKVTRRCEQTEAAIQEEVTRHEACVAEFKERLQTDQDFLQRLNEAIDKME